MSNSHTVIESLQTLLETKFSGTWNARPLSIFNFFTQGDQSGIRLRSQSFVTITPRKTHKIDVGRVFPVMNNDFLEAQILATELIDEMRATVKDWAFNCGQYVFAVSGFTADTPIAPLSKIAVQAHTGDATDAITSTTTTATSDPELVVSAYGIAAILSFTIEYQS